mmetsp:Transcript_23042/g.73834  ORF Transcript_23042/g.73834 Transcript_23042/m.73834 type:complete len:415 (-) Transcript_23042:156-1400(-)
MGGQHAGAVPGDAAQQVRSGRWRVEGRRSRWRVGIAAGRLLLLWRSGERGERAHHRRLLAPSPHGQVVRVVRPRVQPHRAEELEALGEQRLEGAARRGAAVGRRPLLHRHALLPLAHVHDGAPARAQVRCDALRVPHGRRRRARGAARAAQVRVVGRIGVVWPDEQQRAAPRDVAALLEDGAAVAAQDVAVHLREEGVVEARRRGLRVVGDDVDAAVLQQRRPVARPRAHLHDWAAFRDRGQRALGRHGEARDVAQRHDDELGQRLHRDGQLPSLPVRLKQPRAAPSQRREQRHVLGGCAVAAGVEPPHRLRHDGAQPQVDRLEPVRLEKARTLCRRLGALVADVPRSLHAQVRKERAKHAPVLARLAAHAAGGERRARSAGGSPRRQAVAERLGRERLAERRRRVRVEEVVGG